MGICTREVRESHMVEIKQQGDQYEYFHAADIMKFLQSGNQKIFAWVPSFCGVALSNICGFLWNSDYHTKILSH